MEKVISLRLENIEKSLRQGFVSIIIAIVIMLTMQLVVFPFGVKAVAGVFGLEIGYWAALGTYVLARLVVTPTNIISSALHKVTRDMEDARHYIQKEFGK